MASRKSRVAVIGAGPAGAIATDALVKEQAFDSIRVFERRDKAGGTWVLTHDLDPGIPSLRDLVQQRVDQPVPIPPSFPSETPWTAAVNSHQLRYSDTGNHVNLHSNVAPDAMAFSQEPIPPVVTERIVERYGPHAPFRHQAAIRDWVEALLVRGGHQGHVQYGTTVERAEKVGCEWVLTLRKVAPEKPGKNYWWQERFDALVVASGHYSVPHIPEIPGLVEYAERYPGRISHSKHYRNVEGFKDKRVIVVGGSVSAFDALHDIRLVSKLPIISSLRKPSPLFGDAPFLHPDIDRRPEISKLDPKTSRVTFTDQSYVDNVDAILFATGYHFSFPFLPNVNEVNGRVPGLYQHVFKIDDPSLVFVGMVTGGFGLRIFEWQAVAAARVLAGHATLPPPDEMEQWERQRLAERGEGAPFWVLIPDFEDYFEAYRALAADPVPGTTGRALPSYQPEWAEAFWGLIQFRIQWWEKEAKEAARAEKCQTQEGSITA